MRSSIRKLIAIGLCATCTGPLWAQDIAPTKPSTGFIFRPYTAPTVPASRMANSGRLGALVRGNRLYLTAQDAIALALENNIDLEINRYNALISSSNLLRSEAGGPLPGVPSGTSQVGSVASGQGVSGSQAAAGVSNSGSGGSGSGGTNGTISQIGPQTPTLDPIFTDIQSYSHQSAPQANLTQSQTVNLVTGTRVYSDTLKEGLITGGQVSINYKDSFLNESTPSSFLNNTSAPSITVSFQHNFLQGFGIAVNSRNITIARTNLTITDLNFKQQVISTVVSVLNTYYGLSADYEDVKAKETALRVARRFYEDNKKQVEIGTLAQLDVTTAEAQVASSELALVVSKTTLEQDQVTLKNLISRTGPRDAILSRVDIVPLDHISVPEKEELPPAKDLVAIALANRPDLASDKLNLQNSQVSALGTANGVLPQLAFLASASNSGLAGSPATANLVTPKVALPLTGGIGTALGQVFDRHFPSESAGGYFAPNLRNRSAQADAAIDQLSLRQTELENQRTTNQVSVDVSNQSVALQQARIRYQAAVKNRVLEEELLSAEQKKYSLGASTTYNVVTQERDLATAQSTEVAAMVAYSQARINLDQTIGLTLKSNNVSIDEATKGQVKRVSALSESLQ